MYLTNSIPLSTHSVENKLGLENQSIEAKIHFFYEISLTVLIVS